MSRSGLHKPFDRSPIITATPRTPTDTLVYATIIVAGAVACAFTVRSSDFFAGDTTYFEAARSLVSHRWYGFDFHPETVLPPGLSAVMALLCVTVGCSHTVFAGSIVIFSTLGFLAAYELMRREEGRTAAAIICLLLISSPVWFAFETRWVFSDLPYFLASMLTLLLVGRLVDPAGRGPSIITASLASLSLVASLLFRTAGVALIAGVVAWLAVTWVMNRAGRIRRVAILLPVLVPAIVVQGAWSHWATTHEFDEWPIGGYPRSYMSQLHVKNGNDPELGDATLAEIPARVANNAADHAAGFMSLLTPLLYINPEWSSPLLLGPLILIIVGLMGSIWPNGGRVTEWYFMAHEAIYLAWPWDLETRWLLPVAPLAALYLWRGGKILLGWMTRRPRAAARWIVPVSLLLAVDAGRFAMRSESRQLGVSAIFWILLACVVAVTAWMSPHRLRAAIYRLRRPTIVVPRTRTSVSVLVAVGIIAVAADVSIGVVRQARLARSNVAFDLPSEGTYPDIEAGKWLRTHTARRAVVMARQVDVVYHYAQRKVVWFPPISDSRTLMTGIRKYDVAFVVVDQRRSSYWVPPEEDCFARLIRDYPEWFRLVDQEERLRIFEVVVPVDDD